MHLDDYETRIAFHYLDVVTTSGHLGHGPIRAAALALRARLAEEIRKGAVAESTTAAIGVREAARILHCAERHVRRLAPEMGATTISGRWVFDREKVEEFARTPRVRRYRKCPRTD